MEERKQLSVSDKNGILNELTRKGYTQEVVDLVKEDLDFGLSQEQTQLYLLKKLDIRQMRVQSQCIRNGYSDDVIAVIMCDGLNGYQMQIALEFFQKGVPLDTIRQIADTGSQAAAMQQAFQKILAEMKKAQDSVKDEPAYVKQLMEEIKGIVSKIEVQDKRYDALNEKLKIFESTKKDEEVKDGLLNSLGEKDQMLSEQQDKINLANSTIAKLRNDIDAIRETNY
jgi:vacuolar-type H+-ATPase subunit I/STV1